VLANEFYERELLSSTDLVSQIERCRRTNG
jgi:hypothetical protein